MTHEEKRNITNNTDASAEMNDNKSIMEQLNDANHEIEGLRLRLAWFERTCDDF